MILTKILIATIMLVLTTAIHASGMMLAMKLSRFRADTGKVFGVCSRVLRLSLIVICMFIATLIEVAAWAGAYLAVDAIEGPGESHLFLHGHLYNAWLR